MFFAFGAALRLCTYAAVFVLVGAVFFRAVVRGSFGDQPLGPQQWRDDIERDLQLWGMAAGIALVAADLLRAWHQTYAFYGGFEPITLELMGLIVNGTVWGSGWKVQAIAAAVAVAGFSAAYRRWPWAPWLVAAGVLLTTISRPLTGHAVEQGSWFSLSAILQAVHVLGAAVWIGTLVVMAAVGFRRTALIAEAERPLLTATMVNRFSPLALGAAAALFLAGCVTAFLYMGSVGNLFGTTYGLVFLAKFAGFLTILAFGYFNWQKVSPQLDAAALGGEGGVAVQALLFRSATIELSVAVLVLILTAILVVLPMPAMG